MAGEGESAAEQLLQACQNGDVVSLQKLITTSVSGAELSVTTEDGATLITNTVIAAGIILSLCYGALCLHASLTFIISSIH